MAKDDSKRPPAEKARLLIVDDMEANRIVLARQAEVLGYDHQTAENGEEALAKAQSYRPDVILLDLIMPVMDGYETLDRILRHPDLLHIPVIIVSGMNGTEGIIRCLERGADDYLTKPINMRILAARLESSLRKKRLFDLEKVYQRQIESQNAILERRVREQVAEIVESQNATIFALSRLAESRDHETGAHLERMREYCLLIARALHDRKQYEDIITDEFLSVIYAASPLHDIGKVGIPDRILQKPSSLTPQEFEVMKIHTTLGSETLRAVDRKHPGSAYVRMGIEIAECHHERWDGRGYPHGIAGTAIPLAARILALADTYDALTTRRCYKEAIPHEVSLRIIMEGRGTQFDPDIVDAFLSRQRELLPIYGIETSTEAIRLPSLLLGEAIQVG